MKKKTITINGKEYAVVFNMQAMLNFEEIAGKSFFGENFNMLKERIAVVVAAVIAANPDTDLQFSEIINGADLQGLKDLITAYAVVMELITEFFTRPAVEPEQSAPADDEEGDKTKN